MVRFKSGDGLKEGIQYVLPPFLDGGQAQLEAARSLSPGDVDNASHDREFLFEEISKLDGDFELDSAESKLGELLSRCRSYSIRLADPASAVYLLCEDS